MKKRKVPTQPNKSSSIRSCLLLGSNTTDIISLSGTHQNSQLCALGGCSTVQRWWVSTERAWARHFCVPVYISIFKTHTHIFWKELLNYAWFCSLWGQTQVGSKMNVKRKRNPTSREFLHLQIKLAPAPSFQERRDLEPPLHESTEVLGSGTLPINRDCTHLLKTKFG